MREHEVAVEFTLWRTGYDNIRMLQEAAGEGDQRAQELLRLLIEELAKGEEEAPEEASSGASTPAEGR